jgi:hypothetical protein
LVASAHEEFEEWQTGARVECNGSAEFGVDLLKALCSAATGDDDRFAPRGPSPPDLIPGGRTTVVISRLLVVDILAR